MQLKAQPKPVVSLLGDSFKVFLKALPYLVFVYFIPMAVMLGISYFAAGDMLAVISSLPADTTQDEVMEIALPFLLQPSMVIISLLGMLVVLFSTVFNFLLTKDIMTGAQISVGDLFFNTLKGLLRYLVAYFAYALIFFIALGVPLTMLLTMGLPPALNVLLFIFTLCICVVLFVFMFTSVFFTRAAVLNGMWPFKIFTRSYRIVAAGVGRVIGFLLLVLFLSTAGGFIINMLVGILISVFSIFISFNPAAAAAPLGALVNGAVGLFMGVALTVYFVHTDSLLPASEPSLNNEPNEEDLGDDIEAGEETI